MKTHGLIQLMTVDGWGAVHVLEAPTTPSLEVLDGRPIAAPDRRRFPDPAELDAGEVRLCGACARLLPDRYRLQGDDTVRGEGS